MNKEIVIKKLKDLKEYCSEQVGMYGEESEWNGDVKALQIAIGVVEGTIKDVEIREKLKRLEKRVKSLQICISLLTANITIALIMLAFIVEKR